MAKYPEPVTPCVIVGDFTENGNPKGIAAVSIAEVVRPIMVGDFVESALPHNFEREFKILLHDRRVVTVFGRDLKYIASEGGTYAVVTRSKGEEITIALFPAKEVEGIFSGELQLAPSV